MIEVALDAPSLARVAFRASPVAEVVGALRGSFLRTAHGTAYAAIRHTLRDSDVALAAITISAGPYQPDFVMPRPSASAARRLDSLDQQLHAIASTPDEDVERQLRLAFAMSGSTGSAGERLLETADAHRVARGLSRVAESVPSAVWDADHASIDAEIERVCRHSARWGIGATLGAVHPDVTWDGRALAIDKAYREQIWLCDAELVVTPSTSTGRLLAQVCSVEEYSLVYPMRRPPPTDAAGSAAGSLEDLLGGTRAGILRDLSVPRSTSELAMRHHLAKATVSHHLGVLTRSALLTRERHGKRVLYVLSERGRCLVG